MREIKQQKGKDIMKIHTVDDAKGKNEVWFQGDKARFTGKVETWYGGTFGEAKIVSSGKIVLIGLDAKEMSPQDFTNDYADCIED